MCDACGMQYVGQTSNAKSRMNGHKSDYRRFLNGGSSKSDTSVPYCNLESHDVEIFRIQIWEVLEIDGFEHSNNSSQLEVILAQKSVIGYVN